MRVPPPLACAVALAAVIAIAGPPGRRDAPGIPDDRAAERIEGIVRGPVVHAPHGWGANVGAVWVWSAHELVPGQRIAATGRLRTPRTFLDPGVPARVGADWELSATSIEILEDDPRLIARAWRWAARIQQTWAAEIDEPALRGIATGDRGEVPPELDRRWRALGIYHVLSVSGLHLAVVAGLLFSLLRRLVAASPWGGRVRPARWAAPPALVLAIAYTMITGAQLATVRALIAIAVALIAQVLDRPLRLVDAIGVAAICVLAWHPADLWDPSFQLSFTAALTLALKPARGGWIRRAASASLWIAITTAINPFAATRYPRGSAAFRDLAGQLFGFSRCAQRL